MWVTLKHRAASGSDRRENLCFKLLILNEDSIGCSFAEPHEQFVNLH
jgi:hypothetical protein